MPTPISAAGSVVRDFFKYTSLRAALFKLLLSRSASSPNLVISKPSHKAGRLTISRQARLHNESRARSLAYKRARHSKISVCKRSKADSRCIRRKAVGRRLVERLLAALLAKSLYYQHYSHAAPLRSGQNSTTSQECNTLKRSGQWHC